MTVHIGSWIYPLVITLICAVWAFWPGAAPKGYGNIGDGVVAAFFLLLATIFSLAAWLAWALLS